MRCPQILSRNRPIYVRYLAIDTVGVSNSTNRYQCWYHFEMSMNLRLSDSLASRLRALSEETGKSQQVLTREALAEYVTNYKLLRYPPEIRHLIIPAETELGDFYVDESLQIKLPPGVTADAILQELHQDRI
jgi:hypothetical protein